MRDGRIVDEEVSRLSVEEMTRERTYWYRAYRWPFWVDLVQMHGTWLSSQSTGVVRRVSIPRYWVLWWRVWFRRRLRPDLPRAKVVRR